MLIGFPISCLFAWAFELTPEGLKRSKEIDHQESITHVTGRKLDFMVIGFMAIAVIFLTYEAYFDTDTDNVAEASNLIVKEASSTLTSEMPLNEHITSIAVLPFVNMSNDPEQEYFSDGLSEELLNVLSRIKQIKVAARTSSFFFKNKNMDIKEIAEKLDVEHVLEGSVRRSGTKLRVTAQLIQADSGYHLWSATYDYEFEDIFKIQDEISEAVVEQLKITLLNDQLATLTEHGTKIAAAQDSYLKGRYYMRSRTPEDLKNAVSAFQQSLRIDSHNQLAVSGLADTYYLQSLYSNSSERIYLKKVTNLLTPYLELLNNSAEMDTSIAAYYQSTKQLDKSIEFYQRAVSKNSNYAQLFHWFGSFYQFSEPNFEKSHALFLKAANLDPYSEIILINLFVINYFNGRIIEAENYLRLVNEIAPNASHNNALALKYYWRSGRDWHKAQQILNKQTIKSSQLNYDQAFNFYLALDDLDRANVEIEKALKQENYQANIVFNYYLMALTQYDKGLINDKNMDAFVLKKVIQYPHSDNITIEVELALKNKQFVNAKHLIKKSYPQMGLADVLLDQDVFISACYIFIKRALNEDVNEHLIKMVENYILRVEKMSNNPEVSYLELAYLKALINEPEQALTYLDTLYVKGDYYDGILFLKYSAFFADLRANPKFNNIVDTAEQKLMLKRSQFYQTEKIKPNYIIQ
ncbi:FlgO family outer membrane protein [Colwelliaceae bacterium BS250]